MAAVLRRLRAARITHRLGGASLSEYKTSRSLASSAKDDSATKDGAIKNTRAKESEGWFSRLLVRKIEPTGEPHSRMLSNKEYVYALYTHNVRPDSVDKYLANYQETVNLINAKPSLNLKLIGSWTVEVGDLDQAIHLWQYKGGFSSVDPAQVELSKDQNYQQLYKEAGNYLRSRHLQYLFGFSYWPTPQLRAGSNKYELRSYRLTAGTMIEWGNNWAKAINYRRKNDEAFAGGFSQIGPLYYVHHFWCYKDLEARRQARDSAWRSPGWDECVAYTVPLICESHSRILNPTSFSPTK